MELRRTHWTPGGWGNEYSANDGRDEMTSVHENVPTGFAFALVLGGGLLFFLRRSGFVDVSVRGSAGGR